MTLLVCDLDGTLTFSRDRPAPVVMEPLTQIVRSGAARLVIATARSPRCVRRWFPELLADLDVISCNGALTLAGSRVMRRPLPEHAMALALTRLDSAGAAYCLEYGSHFTATGSDALPWMGTEDRQLRGSEPLQPRGVLKCSVAEAAAAQWAARLIPGITVVRHATGDADLMAWGVSKARAVARIRRPGERVIAFGNDRNDLGMLARADASYVVGGGLPQLDGRGHVRRIAADPHAVGDALCALLVHPRRAPWQARPGVGAVTAAALRG